MCRMELKPVRLDVTQTECRDGPTRLFLGAVEQAFWTRSRDGRTDLTGLDRRLSLVIRFDG